MCDLLRVTMILFSQCIHPIKRVRPKVHCAQAAANREQARLCGDGSGWELSRGAVGTGCVARTCVVHSAVTTPFDEQQIERAKPNERFTFCKTANLRNGRNGRGRVLRCARCATRVLTEGTECNRRLNRCDINQMWSGCQRRGQPPDQRQHGARSETTWRVWL